MLKVIKASDIRAVAPVDFKRVGLCAGVVTTERTMYLHGPSKEETHAWIDAVHRVRLFHDAAQDLGQQMQGLSVRPEVSRTPLRGESAPSTSALPIPARPYAARASTGPPMGILQVCAEGEQIAYQGEPRSMYSSSPASVPRAGDAAIRWAGSPRAEPEEETKQAVRYLQLPPTAVLSSSEEEGEGEFKAADQKIRLPPVDAPHAAAEDADRIIAQGYLMKQSSRRKQWRKRWFVLTVSTLFYSRSHMDTYVHAKVPMAKVLDVMECPPPQSPSGPAFRLRSLSGTPLALPDFLPGNQRDPGGEESRAEQGTPASAPPQRMEHCFKIVTPQRTFAVCAPTEEEEIKWLSALQTILNRQRTAAVHAN